MADLANPGLPRPGAPGQTVKRPPMSRVRIATLALTTLLVSTSAHADPTRPWYQAGTDDRIALRPAWDIAVLGVGAAVTLGTELGKPLLAPASCRVCEGAETSGLPGDPGNGPGTLNGADRFFHDRLTGRPYSRKTADTLSNAWVAGLLPAAAIAGSFGFTGPHASDGAGARNVVVIAESILVASAAVQSLKFFVARPRPFVRYGHGTDGPTSDEGSTYDVSSRDSHLSFPSGHTAVATATGVSLATIATLEESRAAPYLWAAAVVGGLAAGTLRMQAEKHYFTDVGTGFLFGAAAGVVMPLLHRRGAPLGDPGALVVVAQGNNGGQMLSFSGAF
jgi:membrane-associated phospholipid phosphatase